MREKVFRRKADRKSEKSDMAESFCCCSLSPSRLSLQMEVNVKQSLLGIWGYQQSGVGLSCEES